MNTKVIIRTTLVSEVMRLAGLLATARVRRHVVKAGLNGDSGETIEGVERNVVKAETELRGYAEGLAELAPADIHAASLLRKQEIIADIAFNIGAYWSKMNVHDASTIMDTLGGSRCMMQKIIEWADEFDAYWEALDPNADEREDYIGIIDGRCEEWMDQLVCRILKPNGG